MFMEKVVSLSFFAVLALFGSFNVEAAALVAAQKAGIEALEIDESDTETVTTMNGLAAAIKYLEGKSEKAKNSLLTKPVAVKYIISNFKLLYSLHLADEASLTTEVAQQLKVKAAETVQVFQDFPSPEAIQFHARRFLRDQASKSPGTHTGRFGFSNEEWALLLGQLEPARALATKTRPIHVTIDSLKYPPKVEIKVLERLNRIKKGGGSTGLRERD